MSSLHIYWETGFGGHPSQFPQVALWLAYLHKRQPPFLLSWLPPSPSGSLGSAHSCLCASDSSRVQLTLSTVGQRDGKCKGGAGRPWRAPERPSVPGQAWRAPERPSVRARPGLEGSGKAGHLSVRPGPGLAASEHFQTEAGRAETEGWSPCHWFLIYQSQLKSILGYQGMLANSSQSGQVSPLQMR